MDILIVSQSVYVFRIFPHDCKIIFHLFGIIWSFLNTQHLRSKCDGTAVIFVWKLGEWELSAGFLVEELEQIK